MSWSSTAQTKWTLEVWEGYTKVQMTIHLYNVPYIVFRLVLWKKWFIVKHTMNHNEIVTIFADIHSDIPPTEWNNLLLISRFGSVWCLGLFWWVQPHWTPSFVSRSPADSNSSHLQEGTPQNLCLHWWRYGGHEPRVWHVPHHGQFSVYVPSYWSSGYIS